MARSLINERPSPHVPRLTILGQLFFGNALTPDNTFAIDDVDSSVVSDMSHRMEGK